MFLHNIYKCLHPKSGKFAQVMDFVRPVGGALIVAALFRTFLFDPYRIPSTSMLPTLLVGDYLFVSRFAYGTHIPLTEMTLAEKEPRTGDVVVFRKNIGQGMTNYIKRVVAVPGDTVAYRNKTLYVNGKPQAEIKDDDQPVYTFQEAGYNQRAGKYFETLNNRVVHAVLKDPSQPAYDLPEATVPPRSYVVLGDNRDHSYDTRFWTYPTWSFVDKEDIVGRAEFLYWSWNDNFLPRWHRLFTSLRANTAKD